MKTLSLRALAGVCLCVATLAAAENRDRAAIYERIICVVPMIGTGTLDDPKRPMFTSAATRLSTEPLPKKSKGFSDPPRLVAYHSVLSDDGQSAIVEFVARDRAAFKPMLEASRNQQIKLLDTHALSPAQLLAELRKVKRSFDLSQLRVGAL